MPAIVLPVGKLPPALLERLLGLQAVEDESVVIGPGVGLDCAVVRPDTGYLVIKSDPITFASHQIGWYVVQVNANDIVTTGATPRWFLATVLLPEGSATPEMAEDIMGQMAAACEELGISLVGGHTEVTHGLSRPIVAGTMIGQVESHRLVSPRHVSPGDWLLLTKCIPIEAAAILARELPDRLRGALSLAEIERAAGYLQHPGISVVQDARVALSAGRVTSMHDPTEGGLASALWELAQACGHTLCFRSRATPLDDLAGRICGVFGLDPLATIASGSLLLTVASEDGAKVQRALVDAGIPCAHLGKVEAGPPRVLLVDEETATGIRGDRPLLPRPDRDEIGKAFAADAHS